jgi:ABC-2 type transport system permease protein
VAEPLSYALPLTYGADILHSAVRDAATMPAWLGFGALSVFTVGLLVFSMRNVKKRWIAYDPGRQQTSVGGRRAKS